MFHTNDLWFAAYLKSKGLDLIDIKEETPQSNASCVFIFRISQDDPFIATLYEDWMNSRHCAEIKRVLHAYKILKHELGNFKYRATDTLNI